jgi:hypothetical protein
LFGVLGLKITTIVSWFGSQNQAGYGLLVVPQNRREVDDVGHVLRSSGLLHVEASRPRVFQSGLKNDGGATTGGACGTIVEVASRSSQRRMRRCDGLRRTLLSLLCCFCSISP